MDTYEFKITRHDNDSFIIELFDETDKFVGYVGYDTGGEGVGARLVLSSRNAQAFLSRHEAREYATEILDLAELPR